MGTIASKLVYTAQARDEIRKAIIEKGVQCPGNAPFCNFDDYIRLIQGGGSGGDSEESTHCSHLPIVKYVDKGCTVTFIELSGATLSDTFSGFSTNGKASIGAMQEEVIGALVVLQQTIHSSDLVKWQYSSDRYIKEGTNGVQLVTSWTYESVEQEIDSGRMVAVKAITNDLSSVEEVQV